MPTPRTTHTTTDANPTTDPSTDPTTDPTGDPASAPDPTPATARPDTTADAHPNGAPTAPTGTARANVAPTVTPPPRRDTRPATPTPTGDDDAAAEPPAADGPTAGPDTATDAAGPDAPAVTVEDPRPATSDGAVEVCGRNASGEAEFGPVEDDVWAALRKQPGSTATELARSVPARRKIVVELLNRWCAEGSVDATPGTTPRAAARYFALPSTLLAADSGGTEATPPDPHSSSVRAPQEPVTGSGAIDSAATAGTDSGTGTVSTDDTPAPDGPVPDAVGDAVAGAAGPFAEGPAPVGGATARTNTSGSARLGSGALHGMVEDFLRERPGDDLGPVAIGKAIGRSSGAVANALERMVASGWAVRTCEKPKRYRIADSSDDAQTPGHDAPAAGVTAPAPAAADRAADGVTDAPGALAAPSGVGTTGRRTRKGTRSTAQG